MKAMPGVVIIGAGQAAGQAAASLRQEGYEGTITMLGDEAHPPYQRPPLSKEYLSGQQGLDRVYVRPAKFYADRHIDIRTDVTVTAIDTTEKTVTTRTGDVVAWDKLLIATGSRPRILEIAGCDLPGIHYLRTVADVDRIRSAMETAKNVVIVGGGYIGLEVAAVMATAGRNVSVLEMEPRILQRVTTPEMSAFYHDLHSRHGVHIVTHATVSRFEGNGRIERVVYGTETVAADLVIIGIGILPNVELATAAGMAVSNGIIVDDHCRTSVADVYAAGDCTNHPNALLGRNLRLESVPNAMEQARVAVSNLLGGDKTYTSIPWFWSDQYDLKLQMVGFSADGDSKVLRGDMATNQFAVFYLRQGAVIAVDAVNSPREFMVCKQLYGKQVDPVQLANPATDLKTLIQ
jgi:3-phenylpropionate/trans-cinnamate dioxygenase ferredoxin reductase component